MCPKTKSLGWQVSKSTTVINKRSHEEITANTHMKDIFDVWRFAQLVDAGDAFIEGNSTVFTDAVQQHIDLKKWCPANYKLIYLVVKLRVWSGYHYHLCRLVNNLDPSDRWLHIETMVKLMWWVKTQFNSNMNKCNSFFSNKKITWHLKSTFYFHWFLQVFCLRFCYQDRKFSMTLREIN